MLATTLTPLSLPQWNRHNSAKPRCYAPKGQPYVSPGQRPGVNGHEGFLSPDKGGTNSLVNRISAALSGLSVMFALPTQGVALG